jgi:predicted aspartyl protease
MITGVVNPALEATIPLLMQDATGRTRQIDVVIDTGFNGSLMLPTAFAWCTFGCPP